MLTSDDIQKVNDKEEDSNAQVNDTEGADVTFPGECDNGDCCHKENNEECPEPRNRHNWALLGSIMISDFFCNFADGVFIGSGFLLCSKTVAYGIVVSTVYHELAQEIADFVLMTHTCRLSVTTALVLNSIQGLAVFLGAVLILATEPSQASIGVLLAFSAGVFMHVTSAECVPNIISQLHKNATNTAIFFVCFTLGAVPIGLVLLDHGHCEAGDNHDDH